jgi:hypothetical protein
MMPLYLSPSEAVVLRYALMSYRNHIAERNRDNAPYPMADGFELVAAETLVARLDMMSEALLSDDRVRSQEGADWQMAVHPRADPHSPEPKP